MISGLGLTHRRGGYRDPESQAFIESWFSKLKERLIWRTEFETLDQAREEVAAYIDRYHDRPHSGLNYRTPAEVRQTWDDAGEALHKTAALTVNTPGEQARTICVRAVKVTEHHVLGVCRCRVSDLGLTDVTRSRWRSRRCER